MLSIVEHISGPQGNKSYRSVIGQRESHTILFMMKSGKAWRMPFSCLSLSFHKATPTLFSMHHIPKSSQYFYLQRDSAKEMNTQRFDCSILGCTANFSRKADTLRHEGEKHGRTKFCPQLGCDYPGTKRASRLKRHMKEKHPELYDVPLDVPDTFQSGVCQPGLQFYEENSQTQGTEHASKFVGYSGQQDFSHHSATPEAAQGRVSADSTSPNQNFYIPTPPSQGVNQNIYYPVIPSYEFETPTNSAFGYQAVTAEQTAFPTNSNAFGATSSSMEGNTLEEEEGEALQTTNQSYSWS